MTWLSDERLAEIAAGASAGDRLLVFLQHLHNEVSAGAGTTNPTGVTQEAIAGVDKLAEALQGHAAKQAAEPPTTPPANPPPHATKRT